MLDLLPTASSTTRALTNANAAGRLRDRAQLERDAELALDLARRQVDSYAEAGALLLLGMARRERALIEEAAQLFDLHFDRYNCAVALFLAAAMSTTRVGRVALLERARGNVALAKRESAFRGDKARWDKACWLERAVDKAARDAVDGEDWINHAGSVTQVKKRRKSWLD